MHKIPHVLTILTVTMQDGRDSHPTKNNKILHSTADSLHSSGSIPTLDDEDLTSTYWHGSGDENRANVVLGK